MAVLAPYAAPTTRPALRRGRGGRRAWALSGVCLLAALLYGWGIWDGGWGNPFYSAAVKSMSGSFTNFLFGSFDPAGVVTVDKPPMALWAQVLSVRVFGYHGAALLAPQVVEGVAAVFLLHRSVRRWAGDNVALLAALILALTPVTVAINHVNDPDTLLVAWLVAAGYALTRAVAAGTSARGRRTWLLACAFFLGCGFLTKMLAAWIVVPGFAVAYAVGSTGSWKRRITDLLAATGVLLVSSFWWPLLHDLWPGSKPYMDNSTDGTALNLIFGYNGLDRILGQHLGGGHHGIGFHPPAGVRIPAAVEEMLRNGGFAGMFGGAGLGRMFSASVGGQISWLIPFSLLTLAVATGAGIASIRAKRAAEPAQRAGWVMWGSWLVVTALVLSYAQGIFHSYYTTMLAPAIAAISAAGLGRLWRYHRRGSAMSALLLPLGVAITAAWAYVVVSRDTDWNGWAGPAVVGVGLAAVLTLVVAKLVGLAALGAASPTRRAQAAASSWAGLALGGVALLIVPAVWSTATAFGARTGGVMAAAGPATGFLGGLRGGLRGGPLGGVSGHPGGSGDGRPDVGPDAGPGFGGFTQGSLPVGEARILDYATTHAPHAAITLAIEGGAMQAAPFIIDSNATVIGMGGFMGSDNAPTVPALARWVTTGKLRYVLGPSAVGGGRGSPAGGLAAGFGRGSAAQARETWVARHCAVVDPSAYGGSTGAARAGGGWFDAPQTLYRCPAGRAA